MTALSTALIRGFLQELAGLLGLCTDLRHLVLVNMGLTSESAEARCKGGGGQVHGGAWSCIVFWRDVCARCMLKRQAVVKAVADTPLETLTFVDNKIANIEVSPFWASCAGLHCRVESWTAQIP